MASPRQALDAGLGSLGLDATRRARILRDAGLFVPLTLARQGFPERDRRQWAKVRAFRRRYGSLVSEPRPRGSGPVVLFPHVDAALLVSHVHGMLGRALDLHGARPLFVTFRADTWREEWLRAYGHRDFVYLDDYLRPHPAYIPHARALLASCTTIDEVLDLTVNGAEIGRPAASRVAKKLQVGTLDLADPAMAEELAIGLATSLWISEAAERLLDDLAPEKAIAFEAFSYTPSAQFFEGALRRSIDTLHWMRSPLEYSFLFRRYDHARRHDHFFSITADTWQQVRREPWTSDDGATLVERLRSMYLSGHWFVRKDMLRDKRLKTRDEVCAELGLDPAKKTAVVYSHVLYDATFWFGTSVYPDYGTWLVETIRAAIDNPRVNWVIKMHPENVTKSATGEGGYDLEQLEEWQLLKSHFPELPPHVRLMLPHNDANPLSLFEITDWALTVRGTVGLELPCFGIPVLTAGTGGYSGRGFTNDSATADEYAAKLRRIDEIPPLSAEETALAQRFTNAVFFRKPIPMDSFHWEVVFGDEDRLEFDLSAASRAELDRAPDLEAFARWALETRDDDLMLPRAADAREPAPVVAAGR